MRPTDAAPEAHIPSGPAPALSGSERVVSHALLYLAGRIVPAALTLLSVPLFVRLLGLDAYGLYALFAALALLTGTAASSWLTQSVLRFQSGAGARDPEAYVQAVRAGTTGAAVLAGVVTLAFGLTLPYTAVLLSLAVMAGVTMAMFSVAFASRQAAHDVGRANASDLVRTVLSVVVPGVWMLTSPSGRVPGVMLAGMVVGNIGGLIVARLPRRVSRPERSADVRALLRQMATYGGPLAGWTLASIMLNLSDRYVIEWILGTAAVGAYSAVYDVVFRGVAFAFTPLLLATHPTIMAQWNRGDAEKAMQTIRRASAAAIAMAVGIVGIVGAAAGSISSFVQSGSDSAESALVLPIAVGAAAWQVAMLAHKPLELRRQTWRMLGAVVVALAVNAGLNVWQMPRFGVIVAAYSTAAAGVVYLAAVAMLSGHRSASS